MLTERHRLRVLERRVLMMKFGAEGGGNKRMLWLQLITETSSSSSFSILSDDRFKASSKTIPPHSAI
jgi:hypothetical protein